MSGGSLTRLFLLSAAASVALLLPVAPAAGASLPAKQAGKLSPLLQRLSGPALRDASPARQAAALGIAKSGPGSLLRVGDGVLVEVAFDHGAVARRGKMRAAGGRVVDVSRPYQVAAVAIPPEDLPALTSVPGVEAVEPVRTPIVRAMNCEGGSAISEGVAQLHTGGDEGEARALFSTNGAGVTVGVLSDSYDEATEAANGSGPVATKATQDVETADLPGTGNSCAGQTTPVDVLEDLNSAEATDEGRAMAQIVHDVAPEASIAFATAFGTEYTFAENIEKLAEAGADVIVDDVVYFHEPFFQEGPIAAAIRKVTEEGVTYLSAAGNDNLLDSEGREIASWEAPEFRDSGGCPSAVAALPGFNGTHCLDFDPAAPVDDEFGIKVEAGAVLTVDLQWSESREAVGTDLDAFLLGSNGNVLTRSVEDNPGTGKPVEVLQWQNTSSSQKLVQLVINRFSGGDPRLKFILLQNGGGVAGTEYPVSGGGDVVGPTVFGHAGAADAIAVGATGYAVDPEAADAAPERYSSRGPSTNRFGPLPASGPAAELASPEVLSKPDLLATDCGATTFFASLRSGVWRFCGTSAAAPHAAGVVALMKAAEPAAGPAELRAALAGTATPFASYGPCATGAGILEAVGALSAVLGGPSSAPETCESPDASGPVVKAAGEWDRAVPEPEPEPEPEPAPQPAPEATIVPQTFAEEAEAAPARPATWLRRHPRHRVRTRRTPVRLVFRFASDQSRATFLCKIDRGRFRRCSARLSRRFGTGRHVVKVKARSSAGLVDQTPAVFRFRVQRVLKRVSATHRRP